MRVYPRAAASQEDVRGLLRSGLFARVEPEGPR